MSAGKYIKFRSHVPGESGEWVKGRVTDTRNELVPPEDELQITLTRKALMINGWYNFIFGTDVMADITMRVTFMASK